MLALELYMARDRNTSMCRSTVICLRKNLRNFIIYLLCSVCNILSSTDELAKASCLVRFSNILKRLVRFSNSLKTLEKPKLRKPA